MSSNKGDLKSGTENNTLHARQDNSSVLIASKASLPLFSDMSTSSEDWDIITPPPFEPSSDTTGNAKPTQSLDPHIHIQATDFGLEASTMLDQMSLAKRRNSVDFTTLGSATNTLPAPLSRSRSLWTPQRPGLSNRENMSDVFPRSQMTQSQRAIHVRRSRKVAQVGLLFCVSEFPKF